MIKFKTSKGLTFVEFLIVVCVIFVLIGTFSIFANRVLRGAREVALKHELAALRLRLKLYYMLHENQPETISEFYDAKEGKFDKDRNLLDSFGNKYIYERENGTVKSGTAKYNNW